MAERAVAVHDRRGDLLLFVRARRANVEHIDFNFRLGWRRAAFLRSADECPAAGQRDKNFVEHSEIVTAKKVALGVLQVYPEMRIQE